MAQRLKQLLELRDMLYQNVNDLNDVLEALIDCFRLPKSKRSSQIRLIDQFLIDLNEEIVDITSEIIKVEELSDSSRDQ